MNPIRIASFGTALALALTACTPAPPPADTTPAAAAPVTASTVEGEAAPHDADHAHDAAPAPETAVPVPEAHGHDDAHARHADADLLQLDDGRPWAVDAALVEGMQRIRDAVAAAQAVAPLDAAAADALAQSVEDQVAFLIAHCRLEPAADATLHVLIARLLGAAHALRTDPATPDGLPVMLDTLDLYPRYFAHPGWMAPVAD